MVNMILVAIAPTAALLIFIYQKDRYDREPPYLLFKVFLFGILSVIPVYYIEKFLSGIAYHPGPFYTAFAVAGFTEEAAKLLIVRASAYDSKYYNEKLDGIVYAVFASLGFATAENFLYVFTSRTAYLYTGITRALFSVPAHMLFAITMGYYLSLSKYSQGRAIRKIFMLEALLIPLILHGTYDYILFSKTYSFLPVFLIFVIYLWKVNLNRLNAYVRESRNNSRR